MSDHARVAPLALIVDDDPAARLLVRHALEGAGFEVEESEDGSDALCTFSEVRPDIVLLDVLMPNMDGFLACDAIRRLQSGAQVPIIMMTGLDDVGSIQQCLELYYINPFARIPAVRFNPGKQENVAYERPMSLFTAMERRVL